MSDEGFFREVSEELRQDRLKSIWTRFGTAIVSVVLIVILATGAYVGWQRYSIAQANATGDRYLAAQDLVREGDIDGAIEAFRAIAEDGSGAYPELAQMSIANAEAEAGRNEDAIASYEAVANDSSVPESLREMADLRAAYLLVDHGSLDDVRARAERLTGDDNPLRYAARDAIGLAAWKAGDTETARDLYQSILEAGDAPNGISQRAGLITGLLAAGASAEAATAGTNEPGEVSATDAQASGEASTAPTDPASQTGNEDQVATEPSETEGEGASETAPASDVATTEADAASEAASPDPAAAENSAPASTPEAPTGGGASTAEDGGGAASALPDTATSPASAESEADSGAASENAEPDASGETGEPANAEDDAETVILPEPAADEGSAPNE
ncbi:hypothetical protein FP2506_07261 [Fulvimarina pelagi HTCC2506]|uniref:Ancillary SecYEG translocon subunit n=1 Tax=Fulvimarina pelagi HTCC2506 TaxID=314231 RepID=Q0G6U4_9HYPH|nr:tetratricopeptide repeat protein [Fulvimarina pelagi]EAU42620.1 hypothetical protein FP2506_07261 [Fulvimarina pelagi HTCC2506]